MANLQARLNKLEKDSIKSNDDLVMIVSAVTPNVDKRLQRLYCTDFSIERKEGEEKEVFIERAKQQALKEVKRAENCAILLFSE